MLSWSSNCTLLYVQLYTAVTVLVQLYTAVTVHGCAATVLELMLLLRLMVLHYLINH